MPAETVPRAARLAGIAPKLGVEREFTRRNEHLDALISVERVGVLFAELNGRGARIARAIEERPWDSVDCYVEDLDGYILCFSELKRPS